MCQAGQLSVLEFMFDPDLKLTSQSVTYTSTLWQSKQMQPKLQAKKKT